MSAFLKTLAAIILLILVKVLYSAPSLPDCDDIQTKDAVLDSVRKELNKNLEEAETSQIKLAVEEVSQVSKDDKAGLCSCVGVLVIDAPDGDAKLNVNYTISRTSKRGEFQVLTKASEQ